MEITSEMRKAWGAKGGCTTAAKYGIRYMSEIGSRGFDTYATRYHNGNRAAARKVLRLNGGQRKLFDVTPYEWTNWLEERKARKEAQ